MAASIANPTPFLGALNDALDRFRAVTIQSLDERYIKWPNEEQSKLGSGSYGEAFRVRAVDADDTREPERVAKVIPKARIAKNGTQVQHLCAELAVSGILTHPNLNHRTGLFHNETHIFVILELCGGPRPDLVTRLAHLFAYRRPSRFPEIDKIVDQWKAQAVEAGVTNANEDDSALNDFVDKNGLMKTLAAECGVNLTRDNPELPVANDLFNFIVAYRRISDPLAAIIMRQVLLGLEHLHQNSIVHRDMKTENVVIGIIRKAVLKRDENGVCCGATFYEKIDSKVIDFGLVKYMNLGGAVVSPGAYIRETAVVAEKKEDGSNSNNKKAADDDDEEEEEEEPNKLAAGAWDANSMAPVQNAPKAQTGENTLSRLGDGIAVTPCGTEIYCSLEALNGILNAGLGQARAKWSSTKSTLPKMDIFGVGACLYCMSNGKPPFRPPESYRRISREERMRQIERLVAAGPIFVSAASQPSRNLTLKLMDNDVNRRYTSSQALQDPFVDHNTNIVVTESELQGITAIRLGQPSEFPSAAALVANSNSNNNNTTMGTAVGSDAAAKTNSASTATSIVAQEVVSSRNGSTSNQQQQQQTSSNNNALQAPANSTEQKVEGDVDGAGSNSNSRAASGENINNNNNNENDDNDDKNSTADQLDDVMEALRNREDDGDAEGKKKEGTNNNDDSNNSEDAAQK